VRSAIASNLGVKTNYMGNIIVDEHQCTSVQGLYAAGDVVTDLHQIGVAIGHAAVAATDIHNKLPANWR
jgi:thioredoxin reductase (NADPH)